MFLPVSLFFYIFFTCRLFFTCRFFFTSNLCLERGKKNRGGLYKKSFHKKIKLRKLFKKYKKCCFTIKKAVIIHIGCEKSTMEVIVKKTKAYEVMQGMNDSESDDDSPSISQ